MCGRFYVPEKDLDDFAGMVNQIEKELLKKAGEICPGDYAPVITPTPKTTSNVENEQRVGKTIHAIKWGFPTQNGRPIFNARSETVHEKPLFKLPFATRRCLIPARGFFEWKDAENSKKRIKHYITLQNGSLMYLAGIYWFFKDKNGVSIPYFTILTTEANADIQKLHNRMPIIIDKENTTDWLYSNNYLNRLKELMEPMQQGVLSIKACE